MTRWECYIEEYKAENGLAARLRDKKTNKKISIQVISMEGKMRFMQFLSAAKENKEVMPTIFDRNGDDVIAVYGVKQKENKNTIFIDTDKDGGGYLFE